MKRIILKSGEEQRILAGHPWVYDNEVARILDGFSTGGKSTGSAGTPVPPPKTLEPGDLIPGEPADVESSRKEYLGRALVNPHSHIIARIYSPSKEGIDKGFFKRRIREAILRRSRMALNRESARLVFAEADFLPGLIIDRFVGWPLEDIERAVLSAQPAVAEEGSPLPGRLSFDTAEAALGPPASWLAVQFLSYGMDGRRDLILKALGEILPIPRSQTGKTPPAQGSAAPLGQPTGIIDRSPPAIREMEGLPPGSGLISGSFPAGGIVIFEDGLPFVVDPEEGQKTGHFLDQRENRSLAAAYAADSGDQATVRVLDLCAYTGGFGIHAARAALAQGLDPRVTAVDSSAAALELVRKNSALNGVADRIVTVEGDLFEVLRSYERHKETFDLIILDPPAFAKSRSALEGALRGYKEINLRAIKLLSKGGILVSCSCSHVLDEARFKRMITEAACDAERRLIQLDFRYQGPDHPILLGYDESLYLKCGFYRAV
ncbi:SAM-dependent methyltransferase [Spirochaetia bacterium]|nr:SAM-dependent methyltransferase [Spirochaetia bacterium]